MVSEIEVEVAKLIWRGPGERPGPADFDAADATSWPDGTEAVRNAAGQRVQQAENGLRPWIRVGETTYDPRQVQALHQADRKQHSGEQDGMQGDEPWE